MHACSVAAKRLKEQEAEEAYRREIDEHEWCEMFRNLKRHPLSSQIITLDNDTFDWLLRELDRPPRVLSRLAAMIQRITP